MRVCLVYLCVLAATFASFVNSKPHVKHHGLHKAVHTAKEKDLTEEEVNTPHISPTLTTFEENSQEQEDEELSSEGNIEANKEDGELVQTEKNTAVLLSEKELVDLLKSDAKDELEEEEEDEEEEVEEEEDEVEEEDEEEEEEEDEEEEKVNKSKVESIKEVKIPQDKIDNEGKEKNERKELPTDKKEQMGMIEESDGSVEPETPVNLDDTTDKIPKAGPTVSAEVQPQSDGESVDSIAISEEKPASVSHGFEQHMQNMEAADSEKELDQDKDKTLKVKLQKTSEDKMDDEANLDHLETKSSIDHETQPSEKEDEMSKNESGSHSKRKTRKQKKNQRTRKHSPQNDEALPEPSQKKQNPKESEGNTDSLPQKAKRRRAGKWGPLVGVNPVQIRATVDLYPRSRPSYGPGAHISENPDPCDNFRCKRGKTCKLDAEDKPSCVCQQPSECPPSVNDFDHVCGTDNRTYDTSCELFATKCNLEGTKKGHRLHLDYTGSCKLIPQCVDTELIQFPLRMRDWLKNVLLQLYEHDSVTPGFLTPKQRFRVKKIFESERRLQAGDHSVELLAQDFEKNYNMYIYPVHWQFAQLDQHPSDRYLAHSELAPLRVPLVPMEHCTSRFFQECDADKDKLVSFKEWTTCFGIKNEDMDENLLF